MREARPSNDADGRRRDVCVRRRGPGSVTLQVESPGFESWTQTISLTATTDPLAIVLQIAGIVETVGVVAPKLEEELPQLIERAGTRTQTITATQLQNGGYYDVAQALQALAPELFLAPTSGPFDYVTASLQGSRTNEILWLVDGVRISNRLYNGTTPLDTIPVHMVERIEILEGGQGLFYGTQAVGGVVNVVTKAFSESRNILLSGGGNTNQGGFGTGVARDTVQGHRYVVYGSTDDAVGYQNFPTAQYQPSTTDRDRGYHLQTFGGKYAFDFSPQVRFSSAYQFTNAGRLDNIQPARTSARQSGGLSEEFNARDEHIFSTKLDVTPRENLELFFKGYYHRWSPHYSESRNVIGEPGAIDVISEKEFWGYKDYGANILARLTPEPRLRVLRGLRFPELLRRGRGVVDRAKQREGECAVRAGSDDPRSARQGHDHCRRPLQRAERQSKPHHLECERAVRFQRLALRTRRCRHVVPLPGRVRAVCD